MKVIFKLMQFIVLFSLISMTLAACGGGGDGSILTSITSASETPTSQTPTSQTSASTEALNSYTTALKAGDTTKALEYVAQSDQDRQSQALQLLDQTSKQELANAMSNATKEYEDDFKVKYRFTMQFSDGSTVEDTFWLVLENGKWKLTGL